MKAFLKLYGNKLPTTVKSNSLYANTASEVADTRRIRFSSFALDRCLHYIRETVCVSTVAQVTKCNLWKRLLETVVDEGSDILCTICTGMCLSDIRWLAQEHTVPGRCTTRPTAIHISHKETIHSSAQRAPSRYLHSSSVQHGEYHTGNGKYHVMVKVYRDWTYSLKYMLKFARLFKGFSSNRVHYTCSQLLVKHPPPLALFQLI